jgi:hypothetical protein
MSTLDELKFVVAERGKPWAWSWHKTQADAQIVKRAQETKTGVFYDVLTEEEFDAQHKAHFLAENPLREITADFFDQMMNVLPPMWRSGALGFFMCEFTSGSITNQFVRHTTGSFDDSRYYMAAVDILNRATWITAEKIAALPDAPRLEWFNREEGASE